MRFGYTEIRNNQDPADPFQRPHLIVRLIHGPKHKDIISLVDSDADLCLFHSHWQNAWHRNGVGLRASFSGSVRRKRNSVLHRVSLSVGSLRSISLDVGFTDSMAVGTGLLGQQGSFEQFHINFQLDKKQREIIDIEA